jgi:hypothetical protein
MPSHHPTANLARVASSRYYKRAMACRIINCFEDDGVLASFGLDGRNTQIYELRAAVHTRYNAGSYVLPGSRSSAAHSGVAEDWPY